jgi:hypothetical protein
MDRFLFTPKQRLLNAYRGIRSDRPPVAPEFWYYWPARLLGVSMVEFEREVPFWKALQTTFTTYETEGWGAAFPRVRHTNAKTRTRFKKISATEYRETTTTHFHHQDWVTIKRYSLSEPSWVEKRIANSPSDLQTCVDFQLSPEKEFDFSEINAAHNAVGEDYLLEFWLGVPFFDFIADLYGFENSVYYFLNEEESHLRTLLQQYTDYQLNFIRQSVHQTPFESFVVGCSYSCNSLLGPTLWRKWDKPFLKAVADELHSHGKCMHIHFHGKSLKTLKDFVEIGIDCVCPFERPPGGDISGLTGLQAVRAVLADQVTMNGNVHTVETLIRGHPEDVRREVQEIKTAFDGSSRWIIGTGDQVGVETPEENIWAMIEEAKKV